MATNIDITRVPTGNEYILNTLCTASVDQIYTTVDDPVGSPDDSSTYMWVGYSGTNYSRSSFSFSAFNIPNGSTINSVSISMRTKISSGSATFAPLLKIAGNYYTGTTYSMGSSWSTTQHNFSVNPATAAAWILADILGTGSNPLQAFGLDMIGQMMMTTCTQVYLTVNYSPGGAYSALGSGGIFSAPAMVAVVG